MIDLYGKPISGIATEMGLLSLLMTLLPMSMAAPVLPTPEALGKPYGLYGSDKENLLKRLTKSTKHLIVSENGQRCS